LIATGPKGAEAQTLDASAAGSKAGFAAGGANIVGVEGV
jgi:hypothetical protein